MVLASETEIAQFVSALFRYADQGTVIALRSFTHDKTDRVPRVQGFPAINGSMDAVVRAACKAATASANDPTPLVFCPPVATFRAGSRQARQEDLANGVAISVELDEGDTRVIKRRLEGLIGPATVVVASGGQWADPETGELHDKLHLHWRLSEPTTTAEEHAKLKHARNLVMLLAGADPSAVPLVHPLRWPGSWHRKGEPRLALIQASDPDAEVHLDEALAALEEAVEAAGLKGERGIKANAVPGQPQASIKRLRPAVLAIPNADASWDDWNKMGALLHRATGGAGDGLGLWVDWSMRSGKYVAGECDARWQHFGAHGFTRAGAGTLFYLAKAHGYRRVIETLAVSEAAASDAEPEHSQKLERRAAALEPIEVIAGEIDVTATLGEQALIASRLPVFRRDTLLVRPFSRLVPASKGRMTISAGLDTIGQAALIDMLNQAVGWVKHDARAKALVATNPPALVADIILSRASMSRLPSIAGVITTPTLRPDGSLLLEQGYDPATRLYHIHDPTLRMPAIPAKPSRLDADKALELLSGLLREFPFASDVDRAVALSAILTAAVRGAFGVAPMHAFRASTAGSGKSYLADVVSMVATGRHCPVMAIADTPGETEKRLQAMLLSSSPIISLDNVNGELGSDLLCQATERPLVRIRIMGGQNEAEIESRATFLATGNSLRVRGDMTRRTLLCNLDANMERPELREFMDDPVADVLRDRGVYVAACLTIMLAYREAGQPSDVPPLASFEEWNGWVRGALLWLGCADPAISMEGAREDDPELLELREFIGIWKQCRDEFSASDAGSYRDNPWSLPMTVSDMDRLSQTTITDGTPGVTHLAYEEFRSLLLRISGDRGTVNARRIGKWLASKEGRIVDGRCIKRHGLNRKMIMEWDVT